MQQINQKLDVNECLGQGGGNNCDLNAICTNTISSYECNCKDGFDGDGFTCNGKFFILFYFIFLSLVFSFFFFLFSFFFFLFSFFFFLDEIYNEKKWDKMK